MKSRSTDNHHETNQRNNPPRIRPFPGVEQVNGVTYDGKQVWMAVGNNLVALDPATGKTLQTIDVAAHAGTAFDGRHIFQIGDDRIRKIDPVTGRVLATIPAPGGGGDSGLAWAEGTLWVGEYRERKIHQIDPRPAPSCAPSPLTVSSRGQLGRRHALARRR
jgi:streptogramin lyase